MILETLPNISTTLSIRILEEYGTVKNALDNVDDWQNKIKGIGEGKTRIVKELMTVNWNEGKE